METRFNYQANTVTINGRAYPIDDLRTHLVRHWAPLCARYYHSSVSSAGRLQFVYDWESIFSHCRDGLLPLEEFILMYNPQKPSELLIPLAKVQVTSRLSLQELERAVRGQFVWDKKDKETRWATRIIDANIGLKWLGVTVFIGVGQLLGFSLEEINAHLDLSMDHVTTKAQWYRESMKEAGDRLRKGTLRFDKNRPDKPTLVHLKSWMTVRALRNYYQDYISLSEFKY